MVEIAKTLAQTIVKQTSVVRKLENVFVPLVFTVKLVMMSAEKVDTALTVKNNADATSKIQNFATKNLDCVIVKLGLWERFVEDVVTLIFMVKTACSNVNVETVFAMHLPEIVLVQVDFLVRNVVKLAQILHMDQIVKKYVNVTTEKIVIRYQDCVTVMPVSTVTSVSSIVIKDFMAKNVRKSVAVMSKEQNVVTK